MMKKVSKIILCAFSFFMLVNNVDAISLKDYRIQYEKDLAKYNNSKNIDKVTAKFYYNVKLI